LRANIILKLITKWPYFVLKQKRHLFSKLSSNHFSKPLCTISGATIFNNLIMKNKDSAEDLEPDSIEIKRNLYIRLQTLTLIQIVIILGLALVISNGKF
jgi:hypothetical protein